MAMYRCEHCDQFVDDDWSPMQTLVVRDRELVLCEGCFIRLTEDRNLKEEENNAS